MKFDFSKMFYEGLNFDDPNIASIIAEHYEYKRLETGLKESIPLRGKPLLHQREISQLFLLMQNIILIHAVGTGKSCAITQSLEQFKEAVTSSVADYITQYLMPEKVPYKKFYILVKGPILEKSFKQQIICKCTAKGEYETEELLNAKTAKRKGMTLKKNLDEYYTVVGYTTLAAEVKEALEPKRKNFTDAEYKQVVKEGKRRLKAKYSNCIFVADEVHILTSDKDRKENKGRYKFIHKLFHLAKNIKIMLATASPMKNSSTEFADILNLILPLDGQVSRGLFRDAFPVDPQIFNAEESEEEVQEKVNHIHKYSVEEAKALLLPYFRGKISFLRSTDINVDIRETDHFPELADEDSGSVSGLTGTEINIMAEGENPFYVTPVTLTNPLHIELYKQAKRNRFKKNSGVYNTERQIANAYLPPIDNKSGKLFSHDSFKKLFKETGMFYTFKKEGNEKFMRQYMVPKAENPTQLPPFYNISPKAVECAEILEKIDKTKKFKKTVIYSNFRDMGVNIISICLQYIYGYEPYNGEKVFDEKNIGSSYCTTAVDRKMRKDVRKRKRFAMLLPRGPSNEEILNIYNSYENRYGDYIQVLFVPQLGREGINTNEVHTFINVDGHWNPTNYGQALGRVVRADAFLWSIQEMREAMAQEGQNPNNARIILDVFNLAVFLADEDRDEDDELNDIDVLLYTTSIEKDKEIQKVMRFIKETAIDCFIHYERNYREGDKDGSPICNYETCKYECAVEKQPTDKIVYDMYDILYSQPEVRDAKIIIQKIFETRSSITYKNLLLLIPEFRQIVIIKAIHELVKERFPLVDKFGDSVYLREDNGTFFVQREYPSDDFTAPFAMSEYVDNTPVTQTKTMTEVLMALASKNTKKYIKSVQRSESAGNVDRTVDSKSIDGFDLLQKVTFLEEILILSLNQNNKNSDRKNNHPFSFFQKYKNRFYSFREPSFLLTQQAAKTAVWTQRGRKPENIDVVKIHPLKEADFPTYDNYLKYEQKPNDEMVYLHTLLSFDTTAEFEHFLKGEAIIRVYKPSEGIWRDSNPYETVVYNKLIQVLIKDYIDKLERGKFYGYMTLSNKGEVLKIIDVENKPAIRAKEKDQEKMDLRTRTKGIECEKFIEEPDNVKRFRASFDKGNGKINNCEEIQNTLAQNDALIYLFV